MKPLEEFESHLAENVGRNFLATVAGWNQQDLIKDAELQGLTTVFHNCGVL